ncbi:MAG: NIL domain-containing protein [Leptolyngbya sp. IPPAS B-1204]|nr:NIL domain-containing protein [Elainella sp. C42_A2020_010]RNJ66515.1 MAG: ABC transporter [Leptolyngbya sp. IPPAS B-1204]
MTSLKPYDVAVKLSSHSNDQRLTSTRIRIRIPKRYQQEPIISNLISQYNLTVNIAAALLGANAREDGWFDLELQGTVPQIQSALLYLNDLDLEIWYDSEQDDW